MSESNFYAAACLPWPERRVGESPPLTPFPSPGHARCASTERGPIWLYLRKDGGGEVSLREHFERHHIHDAVREGTL